MGWLSNRQIVCATTRSKQTSLTGIGMPGGKKALVVPVSKRLTVVGGANLDPNATLEPGESADVLGVRIHVDTQASNGYRVTATHLR